ncbi:MULTISPECIES: arylesterase [Marinovum]|uniref:arylesterase n=1 Tax=Marinovum TaxID=367771 RepID=UPI00237A9B79|nr:arylesterase [Marinovum sp. PR37]MDD9744678.1 arylesterase [Marinovum sp. PR37]
MYQLFTYGVCARLSKACAIVLTLAAPAAAEELEILALGDSLIQGYGLMADEGFVPQMQDWLEAQGHDVTLINGGVSGDTTAGGLARVEWSLSPGVDAMIVALGGNDVLRGLDPAVSRDNLDGILRVAAAREMPVLLVPMRAPGNYGPDYKAAFDGIYADLAAEHGALEAPAFLDILLPDGGDPSGAADLMQGDGIHPNAEGVARIVEGIGPHVERLIAEVPGES